MPATGPTIPATTATSTRTTRSLASLPLPRVGSVLLAFALAWTLFAFAGWYPWTQWPAVAAVAAAALAVRPRIARGRWRHLDLALLTCVAYLLVQAMGLPIGLRDALSPHTRLVNEVLRFSADPHRSLSLDPESTWSAALVAALAVVTFWTCRDVFARASTRRVARTIAWSGFVVSIVASISKAMSPGLLYASWSAGPSGSPFGPFINRNHMGSWLVMALPLVIGSIVTRRQKRGTRRGGARLDATTIWLGGAAAAMFAAALLSLSRSTLLAVAAVAVFGGLIAVARHRRDVPSWLVGIAAVSALIAFSMPRTADLVARLESAGGEPRWSRAQIWYDTLPMVHDFPLTGVGVGAYRDAMVVYQQADRELSVNQAHNQYLQLVAEGGLLLAIPLLVAGLAFGTAVAARLKEDESPSFWIRAGALAGIGGIAVQSLWETGLRMPANALLFAALCAFAIYDAHPDRGVETLPPPDRRRRGTGKERWVDPGPRQLRT